MPETMIVPSNTPLITVIIPAYNRFEEVQRSINSVINQSYSNFEIILVDDYSTKSLISLENKYNGLKVIRHSANLGAAVARNTGINAARGSFVAFLDSDDIWHEDKLTAQLQFMFENPDLDASTTAYYYRTEEGESIEIPKTQKNWEKNLCTGSGLAPGSTLMARTEAINNILYDSNLVRLEDVDMLLRFVQNYNFDIFQKSLSTINRTERPNSETVEKADLYFINKNKTIFYSYGEFYGRFCEGKRLLEIATHFFREKKRRQGWHYLKKAILKNPFQRPGMYLRIFDYITGCSILISLKKIFRRNIEISH